MESLAAYPSFSDPIEPPVTPVEPLARWWCVPAPGCSDFAIACFTLRWISPMSGSPVFTSGGTSDRVATGCPFAFYASSMNVSTSLAGMSVETISEEAVAIFSKLVSTVCGLSWRSIAFITHFCRAIRE